MLFNKNISFTKMVWLPLFEFPNNVWSTRSYYYFLFRLLDIILSRGLNQQLYLVEFSDGHQTPDEKQLNSVVKKRLLDGDPMIEDRFINPCFFLRGCPADLTRLPSGKCQVFEKTETPLIVVKARNSHFVGWVTEM